MEEDDEPEPPSKNSLIPVDPNAELKLEDAPADVDVLLEAAEPESKMATGRLVYRSSTDIAASRAKDTHDYFLLLSCCIH